jgi:hypothetical protein
MRIVSLPVALSAALIFGLSGGATLAQDQPAAGAPPPAAATQAQPGASAAPAAQPNRAPDPMRQAKMLARRLSLTPQQQSEIEPILADRLEQIQNARADTTLAPKNRRAKVQAITQDSDSKIEAILNDGQKQQYEQMKQERRANGQMREEQQAGAPPMANNQ